MFRHFNDWAIFLGIYLIVPIALARVLVGATWYQIAISYTVLLLGLAVISGGSSSADERIGWILIIGAFVTIPAVPIFSLMLRIFGIAK